MHSSVQYHECRRLRQRVWQIILSKGWVGEVSNVHKQPILREVIFRTPPLAIFICSNIHNRFFFLLGRVYKYWEHNIKTESRGAWKVGRKKRQRNGNSTSTSPSDHAECYLPALLTHLSSSSHQHGFEACQGWHLSVAAWNLWLQAPPEHTLKALPLSMEGSQLCTLKIFSILWLFWSALKNNLY